MDHHQSLRAILRDSIIEAAFAAGMHPDQIASYILSLEELGSLDPEKPEWILKSIIFRIENGWRPNVSRLDTIGQMIGRRVDKWLADPAASPIADQSCLSLALRETKADFLEEH